VRNFLVVNHNHKEGLITKTDFIVSFHVNRSLKKAALRTPDSPGVRAVEVTVSGGIATIKVDSLVSYNMIVME
jgi:hypothetical protein